MMNLKAMLSVLITVCGILKNKSLKKETSKNILLNSMSYFLGFIPPKMRTSDIAFLKTGKLILHPVEAHLKSDVKLTLYKVKYTKGEVDLQKIAVTPKISKDYDGDIAVDIPRDVFSDQKSMYLIGLDTDNKKSYLSFDNNKIMLDLSYYDRQGDEQTNILSCRLNSFSGKDIVSNSKTIKPDKQSDIVINLNISAPGKTLEAIDVLAGGTVIRKWNTLPEDIYPAAAVSKNGHVLNNKDSSVNIPLNNEVERVKLNLFKGSLDKKSVPYFIIQTTIDGMVYETKIDVNN